MKTEKEIKKAIKDSRKYFKEKFEDMKYNKPVIKLDDIKKGIEALAVSNEICTLNWVLGKGILNCYSKKEKK
jgi:hypothetical protein